MVNAWRREGRDEELEIQIQHTVQPRYSAPAFNIVPQIEDINFGPKKHFHSYVYIGKSENLDIKHNFDQSLEMRYSGPVL